MPSLNTSGPDRSKEQPAKPVIASKGLDESLENAPVARRELTTVLPPPAPITERLVNYLENLVYMVDDRSMSDLDFGFTNADIRRDLNAYAAESAIDGVPVAPLDLATVLPPPAPTERTIRSRNESRVKRAAHAIQPYMETGNPDLDDQRQTAMVDLLADLRHFSDAKGVDFDAAVASATNHYVEEN